LRIWRSRLQFAIDEFDAISGVTQCTIDEHDKDIRRQAKLGFEESNHEDCSEYMHFDTDFQEEFNRAMDDLSVPEVNKDFTRDFFDNIDLDAALAIPRDGDVPDFTRATARLRDKMDCRLAQLPTAQSCTSECMKSITQMVTKRHKRRSLLLRACARDAQLTRYVRGDHNRNGRIGCEPTRNRSQQDDARIRDSR
jgi:hypothetical protein